MATPHSQDHIRSTGNPLLILDVDKIFSAQELSLVQDAGGNEAMAA